MAAGRVVAGLSCKVGSVGDMVLTVSTSFASGTINTASGTNITLATGTAVAGWVGRAIVLNRSISGRGGQWRKITAVNSGTSITVEYPWRTTLDAADPDFESLPQNGDAFHISHFWDDIDNTTDILKVDARLYRNVAGLTLSNNVTIFDENLTIDFDRPTIGTSKAVTIGQASGIILGNYNQSGRAENGCLVLFDYATITGPHNIFGTDATPAGDLMFHGCVIRTATPASVSTAQGPFMRLNRSDAAINRFIACLFTGITGGRVRGTRTRVVGNQYSRGIGTFFPLTTQNPSGEIAGNIVSLSNHAFYWFWVSSGSGTIRGLTASRLSSALISVSNVNSGSATNNLILIDTVYDFSAPTFISVVAENENITNKTLSYSNSLRISALFNGTLNGGGRVALFNAASTEAYNEISVGGAYPEIVLPLRTYNLNTTAQGTISIGFTDATRSTLLAPYTARFRQYGFQWLTQIFNADAPAVFTWFKSANTFVTAADAATALAVTNPTTANQIYDHSQATYAGETFMQRVEHITTQDGVALNFGLNVTLNNSLTAIAYTPATPAVAVSAVTMGTFQSLRMGAGRTIDLVQAATYAATWSIPATGVVTVADGTTDLSAWTFASGATINLRSGATAATVQVASAQLANITPGSGVELVAPALAVTFTGLTTGTRIAIVEEDTATPILAGTASSGTTFVWDDGVVGDRYDIYAVLPGQLPRVIRGFPYPANSVSQDLSMDDDPNFLAGTWDDYDLTLDGTGLGTTADISIDPSIQEIAIAAGHTLSQPQGIQFQEVYSFTIEARYRTAELMPFHSPIVALSAEAGQYELRRGWDFADSTTRSLLRDGGYTLFNTAGNEVLERWMCVVNRGSIDAAEVPYYRQVDSTNTAIATVVNAGFVNDLVQIFGGPSNGDFDRRDHFTIFARTQGRTFARYDLLAAEGILQLRARAYAVVLTTAIDPNIVASDAAIASTAPYTGMSITFFGTDQEREINGIPRQFRTIVDGPTVNDVQLREFLAWAKRQSTDIDAGAGVVLGQLSPTLYTNRGTQLVLGTGVFPDNLAAASQLQVIPVDMDGEERPFPPPPTALSAPNLKDPDYSINVVLLRQETFVLADISAAINTSTDVITLTGNNFTIVEPATFLTFIPQAGAVLPQADGGPIEALGLYFVKSVSGADVTLSRTEGGATLDFATAGSGAFVVRAWTEIDATTVDAGSSTGYSVELTEPPGTTLLLKARGHQNEDLPATATEYLIREVAWNAAAQSLPDSLSFAGQPDRIYNQITEATEYTDDGEAVSGVSFDLDGTVQIDIVGGGTLPTQNLYAWYVWYTSTHEGLRYVGRVVNALNAANFEVSNPVQIENVVNGTLVTLTGGFIRREDGGALVFHAAGVSGSVVLAPDQLAVPYTVSSGSGLSTTQNNWLSTLFDATTAGSGTTAFSTTALAAAPTGGGGLDEAGVQDALTAQGYTTARAELLDNLDAPVSEAGGGLDAEALRDALALEAANLGEQLGALALTLADIQGAGWDDRFTLVRLYLDTTKRVKAGVP